MNVNDISIGLESILPAMFLVRFLALLIGAGMFIHFTCMAGFLPENTNWSLTVIVGLAAASGVALIAGGISGNLALLLLGGLVSSAVLITLALWLWINGFHVSDFVAKMQH